MEINLYNKKIESLYFMSCRHKTKMRLDITKISLYDDNERPFQQTVLLMGEPSIIGGQDRGR